MEVRDERKMIRRRKEREKRSQNGGRKRIGEKDG